MNRLKGRLECMYNTSDVNDELALCGGKRAVRGTWPSFLPVEPKEEQAIIDAFRNTPLTTLYGGYHIEAFERAFSEKFDLPHSVAMSSGTASLHAALVAVGVSAGDEVIVPT